MDTLIRALRKKVTEAIFRAFGDAIDREEHLAEMAPCMQEGFGHYQCNSAMPLAKVLGQNPRTVAQKIVEHFDARDCSRVDIAGPGFINFTLSSSYLSHLLNLQINHPYLGASPPAIRQRIIVEFSSPNIAKELHVGHIRSTIIGDCLARLFEFLDQDVLRLNHLGDWGTQFGMLITYMKDHVPDVLNGKEPADLDSLMNWYKAAKKQFDEDPSFKARSQKQVVLLQSKEEKTIQAWELICEISRKGFQKIYDLLDVKIQERGESFYNPLLKGVVEEIEQRGLVTISDGAKCVYLDGFFGRDKEILPMIIQKSDGGYNYTTTDLAALKHRIFQEKADRIIVVVDQGQSLHFRMLAALAEKMGWFDKRKAHLEHVGFGLVLNQEGKKFKTRSGDTEKLIDLLTEAIERAKKALLEKDPTKTSEEVDRLAHVIGIDAVKYADLSCLRTKDYTFSYEKMLRFEGNTAVFLLYSYVRICGIKRKVGKEIGQVLQEGSIQVEHPSEVSLGLHLIRFGEVIEVMSQELLPNRLTEYLYELAEKFNAFFRDCRVEGSPQEASRLLLSEITAKVLKKGLDILGLKTVNQL